MSYSRSSPCDPRGVHLTILGGCVPPCSPNPDPISDQNNVISLPVFYRNLICNVVQHFLSHLKRKILSLPLAFNASLMRWNILINAENNRFFDPNGRKFSIKAELFKARLR